MTYEMIRALLVFWLDIGTIICIFIGKPRYPKIPTIPLDVNGPRFDY